jgi:hypothetical protein
VLKNYIIGFFILFLSGGVFAQLGGQSSYQFLNVPTNARLAGLGGVNVSLANKDVNFLFSNPALSGDSLSGMASAGHLFYVADIGQSAFAYAHSFKRIGTISFGVQHMGYGEITGHDATGLETGSFKSGETAIVISKSHKVSNFTIGANLKPAFSNIAGFRSSALLFDIGGTFSHPKKDLTVGMAFKNLGFVLSEYSGTSNSRVPFDLQVGATFKPEHMPLRFSLTAYNIATRGDAYDNPSDKDDDLNTFKKVMNHVNIGSEVLIHRNLNILIAYNFLRQQELKTINTGGSGFSFGAILKIKAFDLAFSRSSYSVGNGAYAFTLNSNIQKMVLKKKVI